MRNFEEKKLLNIRELERTIFSLGTEQSLECDEGNEQGCSYWRCFQMAVRLEFITLKVTLVVYGNFACPLTCFTFVR